MLVNVLIRGYYLESEKHMAVLGVFDNKNIKEAYRTAKERYSKSEIYYTTLELNELGEFIEDK